MPEQQQLVYESLWRGLEEENREFRGLHHCVFELEPLGLFEGPMAGFEEGAFRSYVVFLEKPTFIQMGNKRHYFVWLPFECPAEPTAEREEAEQSKANESLRAFKEMAVRAWQWQASLPDRPSPELTTGGEVHIAWIDLLYALAGRSQNVLLGIDDWKWNSGDSLRDLPDNSDTGLAPVEMRIEYSAFKQNVWVASLGALEVLAGGSPDLTESAPQSRTAQDTGSRARSRSVRGPSEEQRKIAALYEASHLTQAKIAEEATRRGLGDKTWSQAGVSRAIKAENRFRSKANPDLGLPQIRTRKSKVAEFVDQGRLDLGPRIDHLVPRQRKHRDSCDSD